MEDIIMNRTKKKKKIMKNIKVIKYKPKDFKLEDIINKMKELQIIKTSFMCQKCHCSIIEIKLILDLFILLYFIILH